MVEDLTRMNEEKGYLVVQVGEKGNPLSYYDAKMRVLNTAKEITSNEAKDDDILEIEFEEDSDGSII